MPADPQRNSHPIRLVRNKYQYHGFRNLSTATSFARMIGCSDSLIRNAESGIIQMSSKLALRIERATGVSAKWLEDAVMRRKQGKDITNEPILDIDGKPWIPRGIEGEFHFIDNFLDITEMVYQFFPQSLPSFMGSVMESFLAVKSPHPREMLSPRTIMMQYIDSYILPLVRMVEELDENRRQQFFDALKVNLGLRDTATSSNLVELWEMMTSKDEKGTHLVRKHPTRPAAKRGKLGKKSGA